MNVYLTGSLVRSTARFVDVNGNPKDPTTTTLKYRAASGSTVTITSPVHDGGTDSGTFHFDIDTTGWNGPGNELYTCQWVGAGNVQAPGLDYFQVEPLPL